MVKLDLAALRYLTRNDFRVLTALEMGMKNHELVSTQLINSLAQIKRGDASRCINNLHRNKLVYHESRPYDGYKLTYHGYDFLAVKTLCARGHLVTIGNQIGTGKESDVFIGQNDQGQTLAVKFHRLGRTSFRTLKINRDYHQGRSHASWMYLSRLAALKEFAYMKALHEAGFPVPTPVDVNRHVVVMEHLAGFTTLNNLRSLRRPGKVYSALMNLIVSLAEHGLIHGDFNEFNLMVDENDNVIMIDFPQMVSIDHMNADMYFNRDVDGVRNFFKKRFGFVGAEYPVLGKDTFRKHTLDQQIQASGFTAKMAQDFENLEADQREQLGSELDTEIEEDSAVSSSELDPSTSTFEKVEVNQDDEPFDADDDLDDSQTETTSKSETLNEGEPEEEEEEEERPDETRKERRDRLRKAAEEREKAKLAKAAEIKESSIVPSTETPENTEETDDLDLDPGMDEATKQKIRIIRARVKAQLERSRQRTKTRVKNEFKMKNRREIQSESRNWADQL